MNNVLIVGAGRLGKGFMGEIFDNAGWNLSFLDNDDTIKLNDEKSCNCSFIL